MRIGIANDVADRVHESEWIAGGPHSKRHLVWRWEALIEGKVDDRKKVVLQIAVVGVAGHAHDLHVAFQGCFLVLTPEQDVLSDRILAGEIYLRKILVHHGHGWRPGTIAIVDIAAVQHRNLHGRKEARSDGLEARVIAWRKTAQTDGHFIFAADQRISRKSGIPDSRKRS